MAEGAQNGNETLTADDAADVMDEILLAQSKSYQFGLKLKLPLHVVDAIHSKDLSPDQYLLKILIAYLQQQGKLKPTWRNIASALKAPSVGLNNLAIEVEANHFPNTSQPQSTEGDSEEDVVKSKHTTSQSTHSTSNGRESCETSSSQEETSKHIPEQKSSSATTVLHSKPQPVQSRKLEVECEKKEGSPYLARGSAVADDQAECAYFITNNSKSIHQYDYTTETWSMLADCPHSDVGLAIINGELTSVGGFLYGQGETNELMTLRRGEWVEVYRPMKTKRTDAGVITTLDGNYLFVIGGCDGGASTAVEVFHVKTNKWYKAKNLPRSLSRPCVTICGDELYAIWEEYGFSCSLQDLPSEDQPITSPIDLYWKNFPLPVKQSAAVSFSGELLLIGGKRDLSTVDTIYQKVDRKWVEIGSMTRKLERCLALTITASPDKILIVNGLHMEECTIV